MTKTKEIAPDDYEFVYLPLKPINTTAIGYFAFEDDVIEPELIDVAINTQPWNFNEPNDVRAARMQRKRKGKKPPALSAGAIEKPGLIVIFGPKAEPDFAVRSLRNIADLIERRGLITGYDEDKDGWGEYWEYEHVRKQKKPEATTS